MPRAVGDSQAQATDRFMRSSPSKVRYVLRGIKGKPVEDARRLLSFHPKRVAGPILKVLNSAVANAAQRLRAEPEDLVVAECWADEGLTLRRWQPRALGRAYRIRKRTSHVTIVVEPRRDGRGAEN